MTPEEVAAFLSRGRIVDLSKKVTPGNAPGAVGAPSRRYELEQFRFPPGEIMHYIAMESHISTHVEAPSHFMPVISDQRGHDVSEVALDRFFGMGVLIDCRDAGPREALGPEFLAKFPIMGGDIILVGCSKYKGVDRPFITPEGIRQMVADKKIKMLGYDDTVSVEDPEYRGKVIEKYLTHYHVLANEVPLIEQMAHLEELSKPRFMFFGFPAAMGGLDSFPIRAVAVEFPE